MIIRIEPKDWNMHTVIMFFNEEEPHPEDAGHSAATLKSATLSHDASTTPSSPARSSRCGLTAAATSDGT